LTIKIKDLIISAPFWNDLTCRDCGKVYFFTQNQTTGQFELSGSVAGKEKFGRFGHSMTLIDLDRNGLDDLIISAPYSKISKIFVLYGDKQAKTGFCSAQEEIISRIEPLFGFKVKKMEMSGISARALFVSSPLSSRIDHFQIKEGYSFKVITNQTTAIINLTHSDVLV
jgi:hypothetical protein